MEIPKKLKILAHTYTVREIAGWDSLGEQLTTGHIITLEKNQNQTEKESSLLHEIIHCINGELDEKEVEFLAQTLYCVLKENNLLK